MNSPHDLLTRQLRRLSLAAGKRPLTAGWKQFLLRVSQTYANADQERYLLERSQDIASREMEQLYAALRRERDTLESRVRDRTAALTASEARFRSLTSLGSDWYWEQDSHFRFTAMSPNFQSLFGTTVEEHLGHTRWELPRNEPPDCGWDAHRACLERHESFRDLLLGKRLQDGSLRYALVSGEPIFDDTGRFTGYRGIGRDVTEQKIAEENINRMARYDTLTGLFNRAVFYERLTHGLALAHRYGRSLAVLFVDLDRFKDVNDAYGHVTGDDVLKIMARRLGATIRTSDTVARLGGDEFIVLAENIEQRSDVGEFAQRLQEALYEPFPISGRECRLGVSIGIAMFPNDGSDAATLLKRADIAMYRAKESGRNRYAYFSGGDRGAAEERMVLGADLRRALDANQLELLYQPKVSVRTGAMTGVEALVRWHHPERGLLLPETFIPLAEDSGLIRPIGRYVLQTACAQALKWMADGASPIPVAINLLARQFGDERLVVDIAHILAATELPPELLELEITESMMMENPEHAAQMLVEIRSMGVNVSIDDFGTGFSSLARLRKFPIGSVKIDHSFIRDIAADPDDAAIVAAVIAMAHSMRLKVVAEGVETPEQFRFLRERNCDEAQGFHFSRPLRADEIRGFATLANRTRLELVSGRR